MRLARILRRLATCFRPAVLALAPLAGRAATARAQTLTVSTSSWTLAVPAIVETNYDAPSASGSTASIAVSARCNGAGPRPGCDLIASYGANAQGQPMSLEVQVVTADKNCQNEPAPGVWVAAGGVILSVKKNKTCTANLSFRVAALSYSAYPYPGRLGTSSPYQQSLALSLVFQ